MKISRILQDLRQQSSYKGQILTVREEPGIQGDTIEGAHFAASIDRLKDGSLVRLLDVLGQNHIHKSLAAGLARAFGSKMESGISEDSILCGKVSSSRELYWQAVALLEAIDESRPCIVVCQDDMSAQADFRKLKQILGRADVEYALEVGLVDDVVDLSAMEGRFPLITVLSVPGLQRILLSPDAKDLREVLLSSLGRIILPAVDEWPSYLASHSAYLFRQLHIECIHRGTAPSLIATSGPTMDLETFLGELWGKPLPGDAFVKEDTVESVPIAWVHYSGCMLRDTEMITAWNRQPIKDAADELLKWLIGSPNAEKFKSGPMELHYLVDISGSMAGDPLDAVKQAILIDWQGKKEEGILKAGDRLKLSAFDTSCSTTLDEEWSDTGTGFIEALHGLSTGGGTDIAAGLGAAMEQAMGSQSGTIKIILFSDGYSSIEPRLKGQLLDMARRIRAEGRELEILYLMLDMSPPTEMKNLILELGGELLCESAEQLGRSAGTIRWLGDQGKLKGKYVVFLSGDGGLPEAVIQSHYGGERTPVFTRNTSKLEIDPKEVAAVVVSGSFGSLNRIESQVRHLGTRTIPVFILIPPEASSQLTLRSYPEAKKLDRAPLIRAANPEVAAIRLRELLASGPVDWVLFRYLMGGLDQYGDLIAELEEPPPIDSVLKDIKVCEAQFQRVAGDFAEFSRVNNQVFVRLNQDLKISPPDPALTTFSTNRVSLTGAGLSGFRRDAATAPIILHRGAIVDEKGSSAEVDESDVSKVELTSRSQHITVPVLSSTEINPLHGDSMAEPIHVKKLGTVWAGEATLNAFVLGIRKFIDGNLEDKFQDIHYDTKRKVTIETHALMWKPEGDVEDSVLIGLANLLRLTCKAVFSHSDRQCLILPVPESKSIYLVDLAPGGNGASQTLYRNLDRFQEMLRLGGRIALDCPCEGGFAGCTHDTKPPVMDTGCPRCTRIIGPVIQTSSTGEDLFRLGQKKPALMWLLANDLLPRSGKDHMEEKYGGVTDLRRISGNDLGSRRSILGLARKILSDRLGLEIEDEKVAGCDWLTGAPEGNLGCYTSGENSLKIVKGMIEWLCMDIVSHELFHNYQYEVPGLFNHGALGRQAKPPLPYEGKLFIEGSAQWAESHIVDALAIRTALDLANLREGDEYGEGFQIMKWIEEQDWGGVTGVLQFLASGDILKVSRGKVRDLNQLYKQAGVAEKLR